MREYAEVIAQAQHGKVKLEDAGFDWKILGPDVSNVSRPAEIRFDPSTVVLCSKTA